jgi:hypothetical protein
VKRADTRRADTRRAWITGICCAGLLTAAGAGAEDGAPEGAKALSGMSVLGNNEAPKSLVIVPWKTSRLGDGVGIENLLDGRAQPVDRDVFARELAYYELRAGTAEGRQPAGNAQ